MAAPVTNALQAGASELPTSAPVHLWRPPAASQASRDPTIRSRGSGKKPNRGSSRCRVVGGTVPTEILCESGLEKKAIYVLLSHPEIVHLQEQPPAVTYVDPDGVTSQHTFDMLVTRRDGTKIAVAVKPAKIADKHNLRAKLAHIAAQVPRGFADLVQLLTDRQLTRDVVHDALLIHTVRRDACQEHDDTLRAIVATLNGNVTVRTLVVASGLEGHGFRAVVRLIDDGTLRIVGRRRIGYDTIVVRAASTPGRPS